MKRFLNINDWLIKIVFVILFITNIFLLNKFVPINYLIIFIVISLIVITVNILSKTSKFKIFKIICFIVNIIMILIYSYTGYYIAETNGFLDNLYGDELRETYYIAVIKDKEYNNINDINNLNIGSFYNNPETYDMVIDTINSKINTSITVYDDLFELTDALLNNELEAILINESSKKLIEEEKELVHIQLKYIYNVTTKTKVNDIVKDIDVVENPFVIYISGLDAYGDIEEVSGSDVNIIGVINPKEHKILLVTIPRDYYVELYGKESFDKLTHSGFYGIETSVKTIENLLDIDINYYLKLNFSTLIEAVDAIGGVNVYSEYTFNTYGTQFYKGYNYMDGTKALAFSRARYNFAGGDRVRGENQLRVIEAIIAKMSSSRVLVTNYLDILNELDGTFQTNIDSNRIYDLVKFQLFYMPDWTVEKYSLNGSDSYNYTYTYKKQKLYVMEPNIETVNEAKDKIKDLMN